MTEYRKYRKCKKTAIALVRDVQPNETGIETLEGFQPCDPEIHYVMCGIEGEEYPITQEIFYKSYAYVEDIQPVKKDRVLAVLHMLKDGLHGWKKREELQEVIDIIRDEM